jgi:hypothetical protein
VRPLAENAFGAEEDGKRDEISIFRKLGIFVEDFISRGK